MSDSNLLKTEEILKYVEKVVLSEAAVVVKVKVHYLLNNENISLALNMQSQLLASLLDKIIAFF